MEEQKEKSNEQATPAAEASPLHEKVGAVVDRWMLDHIHGSPVARSTEAYNHLKDSLTHLKAGLAEALKGD